MSKEDNPGPYMTRSDCVSARKPITTDITLIRTALIGKNMRGGIVKDCSDMKKDIKIMKESIDEAKKSIEDANNRKEKKQELSKKAWVAITVALIGAFSLIAVKIIEVVAGIL